MVLFDFPQLLKKLFDWTPAVHLAESVTNADLFILSTRCSPICLWASVCLCPRSSWGDGLKLPNCRPSLRGAVASKAISLWHQATLFEWSAPKFCESFPQIQRVDVSVVCVLHNLTRSVSVWIGTERASWGKSKGLESLRIWRIRPSWE